jgi:putative holliday junction resolvase
MRVVGVDPGEVRVGLAVSNPGGTLAVPHSVYPRRGRGDADRIAAIVQREEAELIVVGLPLSLDGTVGPQARRARRLGTAIGQASGLPIVFWDERFSSLQADQLMLAAGMSRRRRRSAQDATAAAVILQDYLDSNPQRSLA